MRRAQGTTSTVSSKAKSGDRHFCDPETSQRCDLFSNSATLASLSLNRSRLPTSSPATLARCNRLRYQYEFGNGLACPISLWRCVFAQCSRALLSPNSSKNMQRLLQKETYQKEHQQPGYTTVVTCKDLHEVLGKPQNRS